MGFVATDYATLIWGLDAVGDAVPLFSRENLLETMETWLADNAVMKRTFKGSAIIAGLIDRAMPGGKRKTGRQTAFSTDILYDTLRKYDPDHVMLEITRAEAMRGLVDFGRIEAMLERIGDRIDHVRLTRVTPLAAPLFLEPGACRSTGSPTSG
jgi:ATP-dependent Lhr-like helicase